MSKSFQFPLQKIIELRKMIENTKAISLQKSEVVLTNEESILGNLHSKKETTVAKSPNSISDREMISMNDLHVTMDYVAQLNEMISVQENKVGESAQKVDINRTELVKASVGKKVVEKLREKKLSEYLKQNNRSETKKESEIATRVYTTMNVRGNNQ